MNHYLDICEAIEDNEGGLIDNSDLLNTDFPEDIHLPKVMYLESNPQEHDKIREWILAVSMDQKVDQVRIHMSCIVFTFIKFGLSLKIYVIDVD